MSRYLIDGILADLEGGHNVFIVAPTLREAEHSLGRVIAAADAEAWTKLRKANGNKSATHAGGGTVYAMAATPGLRGHAPDVLLVTGMNSMSEAQRTEVGAAIHGYQATGADVQLIS